MVIHASDLSRANALRLVDFLGEEILVDRTVVHVSKCHPSGRVAPVAGVGQHAVQFDDPADEIRVRLLPEWFFPLAEQLIQK